MNYIIVNKSGSVQCLRCGRRKAILFPIMLPEILAFADDHAGCQKGAYHRAADFPGVNVPVCHFCGQTCPDPENRGVVSVDGMGEWGHLSCILDHR